MNQNSKNSLDALPYVMPLINFKSDEEFEKYIIDYCLQNFNIDAEIFTIADTFWHITGIKSKDVEKVKSFLNNYYFLKNPKYFYGRYTIQFFIDYGKSKLTNEYIDYHLCNKA